MPNSFYIEYDDILNANKTATKKPTKIWTANETLRPK